MKWPKKVKYMSCREISIRFDKRLVVIWNFMRSQIYSCECDKVFDWWLKHTIFQGEIQRIFLYLKIWGAKTSKNFKKLFAKCLVHILIACESMQFQVKTFVAHEQPLTLVLYCHLRAFQKIEKYRFSKILSFKNFENSIKRERILRKEKRICFGKKQKWKLLFHF